MPVPEDSFYHHFSISGVIFPHYLFSSSEYSPAELLHSNLMLHVMLKLLVILETRLLVEKRIFLFGSLPLFLLHLLIIWKDRFAMKFCAFVRLNVVPPL